MTLISFFLITFIATVIGYIFFDMTDFKVGEIVITPVWGVLLGIHYHKNYDDKNTNHTFQCCLCFLIITYKWTK